MRRSTSALLFFFILLFTACRRADSFFSTPPLFAFDTTVVENLIRQQAEESSIRMYADAYTRELVHTGQSFTWISDEGVSEEADILLRHLAKVGQLGFDTASFHVNSLRQDINDLRSRATEGLTCDSVDTLMARLEFQLTHALMRYTYGQRYGFIKPEPLFNNLLPDDTIGRTITYRRIFDLPCEMPTDSFAHEALMSVREKRLARFLKELQPTDSLFYKLKTEYVRAKTSGDSLRARLARINMERSRWRYKRPDGGRYVWVNLAGYELTAVDTKQDTSFTMRICGGGQKHKSPLLTSEISYMELNPYWVIPQSIVRKEIVPSHVGDSAYFARNNYHAINKETKEEVDPTLLTEQQLRSARYTLRQEKGEGNSLGRLIFRFPNRFSVYLHDTNNRGAFWRENRGVSHGCIRLERPLDLAIFLMGNGADEFTIDRIRISIDLPPLTARGKRYKETHPDATPMGYYKFPESTPLWIDYYTLYPDARGTLQEHPDTYHYDTEIEKYLNRL